VRRSGRKDLRFTIERYGFEEETYFDVSYDPVRVESGHVGGVFCIVTETTERVIGERTHDAPEGSGGEQRDPRAPSADACVLAMNTAGHAPAGHHLRARVPRRRIAQWHFSGRGPLAVSRPELVRECTVTSTSANAPRARVVVGLNPQRPFDDAYRGVRGSGVRQIATALAKRARLRGRTRARRGRGGSWIGEGRRSSAMSATSSARR
jgi:hypothetical protein